MRRCRLPLAVLAGVLVAVGSLLPQQAEAAEEQPRIELVLDVSGSMAEDDAGDLTRIDAAKQAMKTVIDGIPDEAEVGLRFYGHSYAGEDEEVGCKDTELVAPIGPMDKPAAKAEIDNLEPVGFTPIGASLRQAGADLGTEGKRRIILISDGEDTCAPPDPCEVARELKEQGIDLAVDTVGFNVDGTARSQLRCIARVTDGTYGDASDAEELSSRVQGMFKRSLQGYDPIGKPTKGSLNGCEDAPVLEPGQYVDQIRGESQRYLYYRLDIPPGQSARISFTAVLNENSGVHLATWMGRPDELDSRPGYDNEVLIEGQSHITAATEVGRTTWAELRAGERRIPQCVALWPRVGDEGTEVPTEIQVVYEGEPLTYADLPKDLRTAKPVPTRTATSSAAPRAEANPSSGPNLALAAGIGAVALLLGAGAGLALGGRRR